MAATIGTGQPQPECTPRFDGASSELPSQRLSAFVGMPLVRRYDRHIITVLPEAISRYGRARMAWKFVTGTAGALGDSLQHGGRTNARPSLRIPAVRALALT